MQSYYDYKKYAILYVDDEEKSLKYFTRAFADQFRILTASSADEGWRVFEANQDQIAILMTDQRMPGEKGVQLLEKVRRARPRTVRILATAYSDLDAAVEAVNSGAIYKYINKPWEPPVLEMTLRRGLEFFMVQRERDQLLREKFSVLHNMMVTDRVMSLGILAAGLGHHIRNALVAVRTFLDLAPSKLQEERLDWDELRNPNFWKEFYAHVQRQVKRITDLLSELGMVADLPSTRFQDEVQIKEIVAGALKELQGEIEKKQIVVENQIDGDLPRLCVHKGLFQQLFVLLFQDEIASLPESRRLTISARTLDADGTGLPFVRVEVRDNGAGLKEEGLRSVFDPFYVRHDDPQDYGIRLMACYFIVYHHGGKIEVESGSEQGVTFRLTFPTDANAASPRAVEKDFLSKVLMNENLWDKLLAGG